MPEASLRELNLRLVGLAKMLQDNLLTVPLYQRSYSWTVEQVEVFWRDLQTAITTGASDYFMGTVVLAEDASGSRDRGRDRRVTVIDGQQRLATTSILFAVIRDALNGAGDRRANVIENSYLLTNDLRTGHVVPRLQLNAEDERFFVENILEHQDDAAAESRVRFVSNRRLVDARRELTRLVSAEIDIAGPRWPERLFDWVEFLQDAVRVISISVENEADAFLIFETLNDRGLGLTIADLLKNHLLSLAGGNSGDGVHGAWLQMGSSFSPDEDDENLITTFIRHYWSSLHGPTRERELYRSLKRRIRSSEQASELVYGLADSAPNYAALLDAEHERWAELGVDGRLAETVLRLGLEQPRPLLLAAMDRFEGRELTRLLTAVVAWSVRGLIVGGIGGGTTERYYGNAAEAVRKGRASTTEAVLDSLSQIVPDDNSFRSSFESRRVNSPRLAKYYLAALEAREAGLKRDPSLVADEVLHKLTLVHVLPRRANPSLWRGFPEDALGQWALRLGNQVLVESPGGGPSTRDSSFDARRTRLEQSGRPFAKRAGNSKTWSTREVDKFQADMAESAVRIWPRLPKSK